MDLVRRKADAVEGLAPSLKCLIEIQSSLQNGETVRAGALRFIAGARARDEVAQELRRFLFAWDQGQDWRTIVAGVSSPQRRALFELISSGLAGQAVLPQLEELRDEMIRACDIEMKRFIDMLPIKMLVPLLLFQFPAFLLLLFGPLLSKFVQELSR